MIIFLVCCTNSEGKYVFELHQTKIHKGLRDIPLTMKAIRAGTVMAQ